MLKMGLRRKEVAALTFEQIRESDGYWFLELTSGSDFIERIRLPLWIKRLMDRWAEAAHLHRGRVFRSVNRWGRITSDRLTAESVHEQLVAYGYWVGLRVVPFVPTRRDVVQMMLSMARLKKHDILYDLGSGDGRIVIEAAKQHGVSAVGIDIDPLKIQKAREKALAEGVEDQVTFIQEDFFRANFSNASVVTMFLLPTVNLELRSKLLSQLAPGTRIVSHRFHLGNWKPRSVTEVRRDKIYCWVVPEDAESFCP